MALNREQKRALRKQGELDEDGAPSRRRGSRPATKAAPAKEQRTTVRQFAKEVRSELRKVAWPSRSETINYSVIVALSLAVLTGIVFALDWVFAEAILRLFEVK